MHNWPGGTQHEMMRGDGFSEREITCKDASQKAGWDAIARTAIDGVIAVEWPNEMSVTIGGCTMILESSRQRDSWLHTFPRQMPVNYEAFIRCRPDGAGAVYLIGLRPKAGKPAQADPPPIVMPELDAALSMSELRTQAARLGIPVDPKEERGSLVYRIRQRLEANRVRRAPGPGDNP